MLSPSNENRKQRRSLIQFPLRKQLLGYQIAAVISCLIQRYILHTTSISKIAHRHGVFEVKRATHSTRPTLLNSAVGRSRHRDAPGSVDGPEARTKQENRLTLCTSLLSKIQNVYAVTCYSSRKNLHASRSVKNPANHLMDVAGYDTLEAWSSPGI